MQRRMASLFTTEDKIDGHKRKLEAYKRRVSADCFHLFHNLATTIDSADEQLDVPSLQKVIIEHLTKLFDSFEFYFPTEDDQRKGNGG